MDFTLCKKCGEHAHLGDCEAEKPELPVDNIVSDQFVKELTMLINKHSLENGSNTPDYMLAEYLRYCLNGFNLMVNKREQWYGR